MAYTTIDPILKHLANHFVAELNEKTKEGISLYTSHFSTSTLNSVNVSLNHLTISRL